LNFDNPAVRKAVIKVLDFWLEMGIDGFRLDAVPYLFERDGTIARIYRKRTNFCATCVRI
jgi:maltose alpha-D-glucosyltransferase/alpha-amylase